MEDGEKCQVRVRAEAGVVCCGIDFVASVGRGG